MNSLIRDANMFAFSLSGYTFRILILFEMEQMSILWYSLQVESSSKTSKETDLVTNEFQGGFPMQDSLAADRLS